MLRFTKKRFLYATCVSALVFTLPTPSMAHAPTEHPQQSINVSGEVRSSEGEAIAGVTVRYGGTEASTDQNGRFSIRLAAPGDIVFSAVGYASNTVYVTKDAVLNIVLETGESTLDEVVVIGFGTVKRRDLTGSVVSVKSEEITARPGPNPMESLQGRVAV